MAVETHLAGLDTGELVELIEELLHRGEVTFGDSEVAVGVGGEPVAHAFDRCPHGRQRGSQVVADARQQMLAGAGESLAFASGVRESCHHPVDGSGGLADLIGSGDAGALREITVGDRLGNSTEPLDVAGEGRREVATDDEGDTAAQDQKDDEHPVVVAGQEHRPRSS